jgi:FPC/CPF motif-containing protein YcgG
MQEHEEEFKQYALAGVCPFGATAVRIGNYEYLVVETAMDDPITAIQVCTGIYTFVEKFEIASIGKEGRLSPDNFASFDVAFTATEFANEQGAAIELYALLVNMHRYDVSQGYAWAKGVSNDPRNPNFQMSIGGYAWFLPLLWPGAYAPARRFPHAYLPWQSNNLFDALRKAKKYDAAQNLVRENEIKAHGFVPALLGELGKNLEILSYLLPHEDNAQVVWDALNKSGGDHPFGEPNT